jgi:WD40 repeat protein
MKSIIAAFIFLTLGLPFQNINESFSAHSTKKFVIKKAGNNLPYSFKADSGSKNIFNNKIALLKDSSIYIANIDGSNIKKITNDSEQISDYLFSPDLRYLAYSVPIPKKKLQITQMIAMTRT